MRNYTLYKGAWVSVNPRCSSKLTKSESSNLLAKGGFMIRNDYNFDCNNETGFWYIIKDTFGGMDELSTKVRNQVRRAQKCFEIRKVEKELILEQGLDVYNKAVDSYKVKASIITKEDFEKRILSCDSSYDFWGCIDKENNKLVAIAINHVFDDQCNYETFKADPKYLKKCYPYYGLLYEMNRFYIEEKKLKYVCDGARSITEHSNIQPFLEQKFKFRRAYCELDIVYIWWMKIAVNMLYPFKRFIPILKIKYVLNLEAMRRNSI